jgi:hypothetical protein
MVRNILLVLIGGCFLYFTGLGWDLPSDERTALLGNIDSVAITSNHERFSAIAGGEPVTAKEHSYGLVQGAGYWPPLFVGKILSRGTPPILSSMGAFLIRSADVDEPLLLKAVADFPHANHFYGNLFLMGVGASIWLGPAKLVNDMAWYYNHPDEMRKIYLSARFFSALGGLALLCAVGFFAWSVGMKGYLIPLSMLIWLASPIGIWLTHTTKPHLWTTAFSLLSISLLFLDIDKDKWWLRGLAGLCFGVAVGFGINAVLILPFLIWYPRKRWWIFFLGSVGPLVPVLWNWHGGSGVAGDFPIKIDLEMFGRTMVDALFAFGVLTIIPVLMRSVPVTNMPKVDHLTRFIAIYLFAIFIFSNGHIRHFLILGPILIILNIYKWHALNFFGYRKFLIGFLAFGFIGPNGQMLTYLRASTPSNPALQMGLYINDHIDKGQTILLPASFPHAHYDPPFDFANYNIAVGTPNDFYDPPRYALTRTDTPPSKAYSLKKRFQWGMWDYFTMTGHPFCLWER